MKLDADNIDTLITFLSKLKDGENAEESIKGGLGCGGRYKCNTEKLSGADKIVKVYHEVNSTKEGDEVLVFVPGTESKYLSVKSVKGNLVISRTGQPNIGDIKFPDFELKFPYSENDDAANTWTRYTNGILKVVVPKLNSEEDDGDDEEEGTVINITLE